MSEIIRADHLTSLFVSDGLPDNRAAETNRSGVLWAYVVGRSEPVRIDGFAGISAAALLDAFTRAVRVAEADAHSPHGPVAYVRLLHTGDQHSVTSVEVCASFPLADGSEQGS